MKSKGHNLYNSIMIQCDRVAVGEERNNTTYLDKTGCVTMALA